MRVMLVPVADRPECARALNSAFDLGTRLGASVVGCHIRPHRYSDTSLGSEFVQAAWRKKSTKRAPVAAKALYKSIAEDHGYKLMRRASEEPRAHWVERVGSPNKIMSIVGPMSDMIVVSRPTKPDGVATMFLKSALFHGGRPLLVLPQRTRRRIGRRICIGWDQGPRVARVVMASIPLLQQADEVTIVTCGPEDRPGPKSSQLREYFAHWGIEATHVSMRGHHVEHELVDACRAEKADLLVTGAYTRSRWYEKVLGGTTEYLIHEARLPVLMQHD
jgi:nucleotide-binding universal stress UspA family protein